jgi:hypothetical protein
MISWSVCAHVIEDFPYDLSWTGPWWIGMRTLPHLNPWIVAPVTLALPGVVYVAARRDRTAATTGAG